MDAGLGHPFAAGISCPVRGEQKRLPAFMHIHARSYVLLEQVWREWAGIRWQSRRAWASRQDVRILTWVSFG